MENTFAHNESASGTAGDASWLQASQKVAFMSSGYLPKLLLAVLCWFCAVGVTQASRKHFQAQEEAKKFARFAQEHECEKTSRKVPFGFIPSLRNKLNLFSLRNTQIMLGAFREKFETYGQTFGLYDKYGMPKVIHTMDPDNVHAVLSSKSHDYGIPDARKAAIGPIGGHGVVMTEGALWAENRRIINTGFRGARHTNQIEEVVKTFFDRVSLTTDSDGWSKPLTMFYSLAHMSLDRSTKHMFGVSSGLQASASSKAYDEVPGPESGKHILWKQCFDVIAKYVGVRSLLGKKSWLYDSRQFRSSCALLRKLCDEVILRAVGETREGKFSNASFVGNLVQETADTERIRDVCMDLFIAGHNMSAGTMSWLFFELEQRPELWMDVREEVIANFGTEDEPKADMTWENLQKCKKLHGCIYEAMRMYPMLPNIGRQAIADTVLPTGGGENGKSPVAVAKGTVVMSCVFLMHRRAESWGHDSDEFRPERWNGFNPGHEYAPFGAGSRICPGLLFGLVEVFYVTARIMQRCQSIRLAPGESKASILGAGVLVPPRTEVQLQFAQ